MSEIISPFFTYMGNKLNIAEWIIPFFPQHKTYVEVFGGTYSIGLNKPKSQIEIYNDLNGDLSNLFHVTRTMYPELVSEIDKFILSEDWYRMFHTDNSKLTELERAVRYYFVMCTTFRGKYDGGFGVIPEKSFTEIFERKAENLKRIHERIKNTIILNKDAFDVIKSNNAPDTLLYLDPPYVDTEGYYKSMAGSFTETQHIQLRDALERHSGFWFLSYEDEPIISDLYSTYYIHRKSLLRNSNKETKYEVLVTNYKPMATLFG